MRWWMRLSMTVVVAAILAGAVPGRPAVAQSGVPSRDLTTYGNINVVKTDGRLAAWVVNDTDLLVADIATGQVTSLDSNNRFSSEFVENLAVANGRVVWRHDSELRMYDLASGNTTTVRATNTGALDLYGDLLVWLEREGAHPNAVDSVWMRDISTLEPATRLFSFPGGFYGVWRIRTNGTFAVWAEGTGQSRNVGLTYDLYAAALDGSAVPALLDTGPCLSRKGDFALDSTAVWYPDERIGGLCRQPFPGAATVISDGIFLWTNATQISGAYLAGVQFSPGPYTSSSDYYVEMWMYDTRSKSKWTVGPRVFNAQKSPRIAIGGNALVWSDHSGPEPMIHIRPIGAVTPAAPRSAADPLVQGRTYFAASQHSLGGRFEQYWGRNGGLAVFGYPLTEEFRQQNPDTGVTYEVQYLERQRYEYHPELAGTPYEVLLGRLGAELLEQSGRDWRSEGDDQPGAQPLPGECQSFATTNRSVCGAFLGYWRSHGLDLGQRGVSYDESLALFGYPLTAPHLETNPDGDTVLTQWFERARFEWHPGNPAEYQVLLGRLAAEQLPAFGW